jgi:glycosyltransferase involved in cell wall biosynthesis
LRAPKAVEEPEVSVVVGVHNGMPALGETLNSLLSQAGIELEVVVVDDGSTDGSGGLLEQYAGRDSRIRVVRQEHRGLTRALIRGCALARGEYIARQDVGDISLPGRMRMALDCLATHASTVFVSCGVRVVGPGGELLFDVRQDDGELNAALRTLDPSELTGPAHHGSVVFRRAAYDKVGGYRAEFYFAQDLDLWVRLAEVGDHTVVPKILYWAAMGPDSLSGRYRREQLALIRLIAESARLRRAGLGDEAILQQAAAIRPTLVSRGRRAARSRAMYFIGACLRKRCDPVAVKYLRCAIRENPLHLRAWWRLLSSR